MNIGNPTEFTILECARQVLAVTGSKSRIRREALPEDDPRQRCPDITESPSSAAVEIEIDLAVGSAPVAGLLS